MRTLGLEWNHQYEGRVPYSREFRIRTYSQPDTHTPRCLNAVVVRIRPGPVRRPGNGRVQFDNGFMIGFGIRVEVGRHSSRPMGYVRAAKVRRRAYRSGVKMIQRLRRIAHSLAADSRGVG